MIETLTKRETEVLSLILEGKSNPEIAELLIISIHTVKTHIENIYKKLNVHNKVEATIITLRNNLVDLNTIKTCQQNKKKLNHTDLNM